ncbi:MAG TPA: sigma-70 family RNA polymerase sigma factor, partial [Gemmiger qucibialis]|nr:sigma-70 family RNA polymerase sigma factor [Gemmiger qucibialis]
MHDIPLNDTQRFFAEKNHNLVYKFLHEKNLPASEYYDIIIFGYLRAVQRYLTDPNLAGYSFATVAWRAMEGEIVNAHRTARRRFRVIRFVRPRQTYTGHLTRHSTPTVTDEEALRESEVALLLHALAKRVTPQQMEIIRLRTKGYQ